MHSRLQLAVVMVCAGLSILHADEQQKGIVRGRVIDAETKIGVPSQNVVITGTKLGTATDAQGEFVLTNVPLGDHTLEVSGIGYSGARCGFTLTAETRTTIVTMSLSGKTLPLAEVRIVIDPLTKSADMPVSMHSLTGRQIQTSAGALDDVVRTLTCLPGVAPVRLDRADLVVRGGAPLENLYLVDNIEFPVLSHFAVQGLSSGSSSVFNPDFISGIAFSSGGFGARNGDKLSSVLSLSLRNGNADHHSAGATISATQFGLTCEGPLTKDGSYLAAARRSYLEPVFKAYDMNFTPVYWDGLVKAQLSAGQADRIEALAVGSLDRIHEFSDLRTADVTNGDFVFSDQDMIIGGITWKHVARRWFTIGTVSQRWGNFDYFQLRADTVKSSRITSREKESLFSLEGFLPLTESTELSLGVKYRYITFAEEATLGEMPWAARYGAGCAHAEMHVDTTGSKYAGFMQLSQTIGTVVVTAGVRADYFDMINYPMVAAPRISLAYRGAAVFGITLSAGRYYQAPAYQWLINPYNKKLRPAGADQLVLGITSRFGDAWKLSIEGYKKRYFDYPSSIEAPWQTIFNSGSSGPNFKDFGLDSLANVGRGTSQGIEVMVESSGTDDPFSGSVSVSYSSTMFSALDGVTRPADHDQRWVVSCVAGYRMTNAWAMSCKFLLFTGHPYTDMTIPGDGSPDQYARMYNAKRLGVNHMLDVRIMRTWILGGSRVEAFLDVQNIYDKKPYMTPEIDMKTGLYRDTEIIGIVPSIGVVVSL